MLEIVEVVLSLNSLNKDLGPVVLAVAASFEFNYEEGIENKLSVNSDLADIINQAQVVVNALINELGLTTVEDLTTAEISTFLDEQVVESALDLVLTVLNTTIATNVALETYENFDFAALSDFAELLDLSFYGSSQALTAELATLINAIKDTNAAGLAGAAKDFLDGGESTKLTTDLTSSIASLVHTLLKTEFIKAKNDAIVELVLELTGLSVYANEIHIGLTADSDALPATIKGLLDEVIEEYKYASLFKSITLETALDKFLTASHIEVVITEIKSSTETTIFRSAYVIGVFFLDSFLGEMYPELAGTLDASELSYKAVAQEYNSILFVVFLLVLIINLFNCSFSFES